MLVVWKTLAMKQSNVNETWMQCPELKSIVSFLDTAADLMQELQKLGHCRLMGNVGLNL